MVGLIGMVCPLGILPRIHLRGPRKGIKLPAVVFPPPPSLPPPRILLGIAQSLGAVYNCGACLTTRRWYTIKKGGKNGSENQDRRREERE